MDTPNDIKNIFSKIYNQKGYFDFYGGSFTITLVILFIFFIIFSYFYVMSQIKPIKADWIRQRCSPMVIPFAGLINKPEDKGNLEFTNSNFNYCINSMFEKISSNFFRPILFVMNIIYQTITIINDNIQEIRIKIGDITDNLVNINDRIISRVFGFIIPIQYMFIKLRDILQKTTGVIVAKMFALLTGYYSLLLFVRVFISIMIGGLVLLGGIIAKLLASIFLAPVAAPLLVIFITVTGFLIPILAGLARILSKSRRSLPKRPKCFDEYTIIETNDGTKYIKDITPGDVLKDGSIVHSMFKVLRCHYEKNILEETYMYQYKGCIVSGNHNVLIENKWKPVSTLPNAHIIKDYNKEYIYCINTTNKCIYIQNNCFSDWDDLEDEEINYLEKRLSLLRNNKERDIKNIILKKYTIMNHLEGGFIGNTKIELHDGSFKSFENIKIKDRLKDNVVVIGIVEILNDSIYKIKLPNKKTIYGKLHNMLYIENKPISTMNLEVEPGFYCNSNIKLYHILTDKNYFYLEGYKFTDYNGNIETLL